MKWQTVTALVVVGVVVLWVLYDLVAYAFGGNDATISKTCLNIATRNPGFMLGVAFVFGVLCGHLFLPQHLPADPPLTESPAKVE